MSLYRKYRPQSFSDIVGQDHIKKILQEAVKQKRASHAYLFSGPRGTGKTSTARILAKAVNCTQICPDGEPCNACEMCQQIKDARLTDLIEIDAASNRGIDEMRALREKIHFSPSLAAKKVYIIDEVHMLTKEAFNALLKTLEEPPDHIVFILATTEIHKVPETIISRCQHFRFKRINQNDIKQRLCDIAASESLDVDDEVFSLISQSVNGGLRDGISMLDQVQSADKLTADNFREQIGVVDEPTLEDFFLKLSNRDIGACLQVMDHFFEAGLDLEQCCLHILFFLRHKLREAITTSADTSFILACLDAFDGARVKLKFSAIPQLPLEVAIIELCSEKKVQNNEAVSTADQSQSPQKPAKKNPTTSAPLEVSETTATVKTLQTKPTATKNDKGGESQLDIELLRESWPHILKALATPFIRLSLKPATLIRVEKNSVYIGIPTFFTLEKLNNSDAKNEIMEAIFKVTDMHTGLEFELCESKPITPPDVPQEAPIQNIHETVGDVFGA